MTGGNTPNLLLKGMEGHFLDILPLKKILEFFQTEKKTMNLIQKETFKPEIKPMNENLQDKFYQLENKQTKGARLCANIRWELKGENCSETFFRSY